VLRKDDVLLAIDGYEIDGDGNIRDPLYGLLWFEVLLARHHAGDTVTVRVRREGADLDLAMPLRTYTADSWLVPADRTRRRPTSWRVARVPRVRRDLPHVGRRAAHHRAAGPHRADTDRRRVVVLSSVLADPYNLGYQGSLTCPCPP